MNNLFIDGICFISEKSETNVLLKTEYGGKFYKCLIPDFMMDYLKSSNNLIKINLDSGFGLVFGNVKLNFEETSDPEDKYLNLETKWGKKFSELETKWEEKISKLAIQYEFQPFNILNYLSYEGYCLPGQVGKLAANIDKPSPINYFKVNPNYEFLDLFKKSILVFGFVPKYLHVVKKFKLTDNLDYKFENIICSEKIRLDLVDETGNYINIIPDKYLIEMNGMKYINHAFLTKDFLLTHII